MAAEKAKRSWSFGSVAAVMAVFAVGAFIGLAFYTFVYAKGFSYLSTDPAACINCHIMDEEYDAWLAGPHANAATCSDCHLPHDNIVNKYYVKAENGFMHGLKFTTGWHPENIEIREVSLNVTNDACIYCHGDFTEDIRHQGAGAADEELSCVRCHSGVGHR